MGWFARIWLLFVLTLAAPFATATDIPPKGSAMISQRSTPAPNGGKKSKPVEVRSDAGPQRRIAMAGVFMTGFILVLRLGWVRRRSAGQAKHSGTVDYPNDR